MRVRVVYSAWGGDGFDAPLAGGEHDLDALTDQQARSVAGAEAAGALVVVDATPAERKILDPHVQSQEDGEAAYAEAQESGRWQHGNLVNFVAGQKGRLVHDDAVVAGKGRSGEKALSVEARLEVERQIVEAEGALSLAEVPE